MNTTTGKPRLRKPSHLTAGMVPAVTLGLFILLAVLATYPTAVRLSKFTVFATDSLLEAWTLGWDIHSLLVGPAGVEHIWDANMFYPYPTTLAFSEHLFPTAFLLAPFTLLGTSPMVAANLGVLFTTALSGWGTYLLVTWLTRNRWAGLVAGIFFAVSPFRMGHIIQLHLLSTHWVPFAFLAMARLIKFNRTSDLILLILFANLQFFSAINYAPLVAIGLAVWALFFILAYRKRTSLSSFIRLLLFGAVTLALNWPILHLYQQVSDRMGVVRTLGDARVYGASIANYILPMANSLLYARWLQVPTLSESAFPGVIVMVLALAGVVLALRPKDNWRLTAATLALLVMVSAGFSLSFGANEVAFGESLSPVVARLLPYPYLYNVLPLLQGLRVPLRFALLVTFGLAVLAGIGFAGLGRRLWANGQRLPIMAALISVLILIEHLPSPLPGESVPYGGEVYSWLAGVPEDAIVLEMPYYLHTDRSFMELQRVYQSVGHWRHLVNGASGFKPTWLVELGRILDVFPDWRSLDVLQQLEVDYVVLHRHEYDSMAWDNLVALLPGYLPAIQAIYSVGDDLVLQLKPPDCTADASRIRIDASEFPVLSFYNGNSATFFADPHLASLVTIGQRRHQFLEPLFVTPGQMTTLTLPADAQADLSGWQVRLGNLRRTIASDDVQAFPSQGMPSSPPDSWQSLQILFVNGAVLQGMAVGGTPKNCAELILSLEWTFSPYAGEVIRVELTDRFGRLVTSSETRPVVDAAPIVSTHTLFLAETVPPGLYQLGVQLLAVDGSAIPSVGPSGKPATNALSMPIVIQPGLKASPPPGEQEASQFANGTTLLGFDIGQANARAGEWVRFALQWQSPSKLATDYTVFTQFLGPDGRVWGQHDNPPKGGWYPMPLWSPGEVVVDDYAVRIDPAAPPGDYHLIVGMYDPATGTRVGITHGPGQGDNFVDIAVFVIHP
jgi:hypothetical protein